MTTGNPTDIDRILEEDRNLPKKQRHTAKRIFERLRDEHGFTGKWRKLNGSDQLAEIIDGVPFKDGIKQIERAA